MTEPERYFRNEKEISDDKVKRCFTLERGRKDSAGQRMFHVDPIKLLMDERDLL
jgi:hypothetical protein